MTSKYIWISFKSTINRKKSITVSVRSELKFFQWKIPIDKQTFCMDFKKIKSEYGKSPIFLMFLVLKVLLAFWFFYQAPWWKSNGCSLVIENSYFKFAFNRIEFKHLKYLHSLHTLRVKYLNVKMYEEESRISEEKNGACCPQTSFLFFHFMFKSLVLSTILWLIISKLVSFNFQIYFDEFSVSIILRMILNFKSAIDYFIEFWPLSNAHPIRIIFINYKHIKCFLNIYINISNQHFFLFSWDFSIISFSVLKLTFQPFVRIRILSLFLHKVPSYFKLN